MTNSLRTRGRRTQDGVVLAEDPIVLLSVVLMALVARGDRVLGHLRLERILVAEAEVRPVAGLVLEALRVLDRGLQARELALEVAVAAGRILCADAAEFFDQDGAVPVLAGLLVLGEALGVHVDFVELGERGLAVVHVVGGQRRADVHPLAIADGLFEFAVGGELDQRRRGVGLCGGGRYCRPSQHVGQPGDRRRHRGPRDRARSAQSKHGATSSLSENGGPGGSWLTPCIGSATLRRTLGIASSMPTSESDRLTMNRHSFDFLYANAAHHPLCSLTCQASPSVQSEIPSRARSLMRNCPGTAERAGKPPRLGSQTPGVVTRKLRVVRNIPTARALPRAEARGQNGRAAMSSAMVTSTTPSMAEKPGTLMSPYTQLISGLLAMNGRIPSAS